MTGLKTNRELYLFGTEFARSRAATQPELIDYLRHLRRAANALRDRSGLTLHEFAKLLRSGYEPSAGSERPPAAHAQFALWDATLADQIRDLEQMRAAGVLDNEYRYFGVDAPSGARWYNFDPASFVECGLCGSLGGWEAGDEGGRDYVPGLVAVPGPGGTVDAVDPREIESPTFAIDRLGWGELSEFLRAGQAYE